MKITVTYASGKIIEHDISDHFTVSEPFKKDIKGGIPIASEYRLRADLINERGLTLEVFWHDAKIDDSTRKTPHDTETDENGEQVLIAHAEMRTGRLLKLIDKAELDDIVEILLDGKLLFWRQEGQLINAIKFSLMELFCFSNAATASINKRAIELDNYLANAYPSLPQKERAEMIGYPLEVLEKIKNNEIANI
ncbi:MAG: hypothetical protein FWC47_11595 [Oscillospiraceae bacterium]|nr:hypothetical protein [Oscillospiraceae bacterium]